jgi:probable H4MPT-linked C1 transfer pathway protein
MILGLDIGGANVKAYHTAGIAQSLPFPLWRRPAELPTFLAESLSRFPPTEVLAVTMTGELCDCFADKRAGVHAILDAVGKVAQGRRVRVWQTDGRFVDLPSARKEHLKTAAANWHALTTFAGRFAPEGPALLFDIGSTTADLIPLLDGVPVPRGRTDPERMASRELVYTGVRRTPLCALLGERVAAELFATTLDAYLVLGLLGESEQCETADGREVTQAAAEARLARMLCADLETSTPQQRRQLAVDAVERQVEILQAALRHVSATLPGPPRNVVLAGEGEFLARRVVKEQGCTIVSLAERLGPEASTAACAYAVEILAGEEET